MKKFIFVSDFDGTMTKRDFYLIVMDKVESDWPALIEEWRSKKITTFAFLAEVFKRIGKEESEIIKDILTIEFDPAAAAVVNQVKDAGGDFAVLSAGADYYIGRVLAHHGIQDVRLIANKGVYQDKSIKMTPIESDAFYSPLYGIDKGAVIRVLKQEYETVFFAGDSRPDLEAAQAADVAFATGELAGLLTKSNSFFIPYTSFKDIEQYLMSHF